MSDEFYAKLDQRIVYSSMWEEDGDTCKVWVTLLALKNINTGVVDKNITGIARLCKLPVEKVEQAFLKFQAPDPQSSSKEFDGRRIVQVEGGWRVVQHEKYMALGWSEEKKAYERERKARYRAKTPSPAEPSENPKKGKPTGYHEHARTVLHLIGEHSGKKFLEVDSHLVSISARLSEKGVDLDGVRLMLKRQWELWKDQFTTGDNPKPMREYYQPSTLFRPGNFGNYYASRELPVKTPTKPIDPANRNTGTCNDLPHIKKQYDDVGKVKC